MRTTVDIPDPIYRKLKARAAEQGCSVKQLVLSGVHKELEASVAVRKRRLKFPLIQSKQPGKLDLTNEQIYEIIPFP